MVWHERLRLPDAVQAYTVNPRRIIHSPRGACEIGYDADIILLSENIFQIPTERLVQTQVITTILGGKVVYSIL